MILRSLIDRVGAEVLDSPARLALTKGDLTMATANRSKQTVVSTLLEFNEGYVGFKEARQVVVGPPKVHRKDIDSTNWAIIYLRMFEIVKPQIKHLRGYTTLEKLLGRSHQVGSLPNEVGGLSLDTRCWEVGVSLSRQTGEDKQDDRTLYFYQRRSLLLSYDGYIDWNWKATRVKDDLEREQVTQCNFLPIASDGLEILGNFVHSMESFSRDCISPLDLKYGLYAINKILTGTVEELQQHIEHTKGRVDDIQKMINQIA